jgi:uncharacterized protein
MVIAPQPTTVFPAAGAAVADLLLAHGAGAGIESSFMMLLARALAAEGISVELFEFAYMVEMRRTGVRRPPPRLPILVDELTRHVRARRSKQPLLIAGKSMGGRVSTHVATDLELAKTIRGVIAFGYPFHPPRKPDATRTAHLSDINVPTLIVQGTRDPFGTRAEVESYRLPKSVSIYWLNGGDHDFGFRAKQNGTPLTDALPPVMVTAARVTRQFIDSLLAP